MTAVPLAAQDQTIASGESPSMPERTRVAIYCRVSTEEQANKGVSLAAQEERLRTYAHLRGWRVTKVYTDAGASAKTLRRDALEQLLDDAKAKRFDAVLVFKVDRLSRNLYDLLTLVRKWQKRKISLVSFSESFDTDTPIGAAMLQMLGTFAEFEQKQVSARTKEAVDHKRRNKQAYGPAPFGFKKGQALRNGARVEHRLEPVPEQVAIVRRIYRLSSTGKALAEIARTLNDENVPGKTKARRPWTATTVRRILRNPVYRVHEVV